MPEYLSPAVYIEEIAGQRPIEAVSTSTTGMVGVTQKGPTAGTPTLVTSYAEFVDIFGGPVPKPEGTLYNQWAFSDHDGGHWWDFPLAVRGFFDNGGRRLFVKRVLPATATASAGDFEPMIVDINKDESGIAKDDFITAPLAGAADFKVTFYARDRGSWSKEKLNVVLRPVRSRQVTAVVRGKDPLIATLNTALPVGASSVVVTYTDDAFADVAPGQKALIRIGRERFEVTFASKAITNGTKTVTVNFKPTPTESSPAKTPVQRLREASRMVGTDLVVEVSSHKLDGKELFYEKAMVLAGTPEARYTVGGAAQSDTEVRLTPFPPPAAGAQPPPSPPVIYEGELVTIVEAAVDIKLRIDGREVTERLVGLGFSEKATQPFTKAISAQSRLVDAEFSKPDPDFGWGAFPASGPDGATLNGGDDKLGSLGSKDFAGADNGPGRRTGVLAFEDIDDINLCAAPGIWAQSVRDALITHCELMRNRFAVLDPPPGKSITEIMAFRAPIASSYAALYYPWIRVAGSDGLVDIGPSGHIAGLYARVDNDRGVHKAPANEVLRTIDGFSDTINQREQDLLNPVGINALRSFPNRGNLVWGARTVSSDPQWRYVSVRRLFLNIEESIRRGTQWVVFEPNAEDLWARVRQSITDFLDIFWRSGALEGTTQQQAFFVRCDRSTMTPADIAAGRLIVEIGIAPVKPAEFVIFRFQQKTRDQVA